MSGDNAMKEYNDSIIQLGKDFDKAIIDYLKRRKVNLGLVIGVLHGQIDVVKMIGAREEQKNIFTDKKVTPSYVG